MMASERPLQRFSDAYLDRCRELSPEDIVRFLEISVNSTAPLHKVPYQTQIKNFMQGWLEEP